MRSDLKEMFLAVLAVIMVLAMMSILVWFAFAIVSISNGRLF